MPFRVVEQEEEVRANLQTEAKEERVYQCIDHLDRATEHIFRSQLEGATDCDKDVTVKQGAGGAVTQTYG